MLPKSFNKMDETGRSLLVLHKNIAEWLRNKQAALLGAGMRKLNMLHTPFWFICILKFSAGTMFSNRFNYIVVTMAYNFPRH